MLLPAKNQSVNIAAAPPLGAASGSAAIAACAAGVHPGNIPPQHILNSRLLNQSSQPHYFYSDSQNKEYISFLSPRGTVTEQAKLWGYHTYANGYKCLHTDNSNRMGENLCCRTIPKHHSTTTTRQQCERRDVCIFMSCVSFCKTVLLNVIENHND